MNEYNIPKIIHYCWFGKKELPELVNKCIASWKKHLPEYEIMFWNENNSPMDHPFVKQAMEIHKFAFVSDYVRLWAVYKYGGIYLDTDMYAVKSLDKLLINNVFFGYEDERSENVSVGIFGATQGHKFIKQIMSVYDELILPSDLTLIAIPIIVTDVYNKYENKHEILIYPVNYFYPFPQKKRKDGNFLDYKTEDTYAIHLWNLSWLTTYEKILLRFRWGLRYIKKCIGMRDEKN